MVGDAVPLTEGGIGAALERVRQAVGAPPGATRAQQLSLIPTSATATPDPGVERTGEPGRPKGATNKRTEEWAQYLLSRYPSPLIGLAETYARPLVELAREIAAIAGVPNLTVGEILELLRVQQNAADKLAPYLHSRQPLAIEAGGGIVPLLFAISPELGRMAAAAHGVNGPMVLRDVTPRPESEIVENQPLTAPDSAELERPELERNEERPADAGEP